MATDRNRLRGVVVAAAKGLNGREAKNAITVHIGFNKKILNLFGMNEWKTSSSYLFTV